MIGPKEKGCEKESIRNPPADKPGFTSLPRYIAYKSALLREKLLLSRILAIVIVLAVGHFIMARIELAQLQKELRRKEYILAPGVIDFTTASPGTVPDRYIEGAVREFIYKLGNVDRGNIEDQYRSLMESMGSLLRIQFEADVGEWVTQVKSEGMAQIVDISSLKIKSDDLGKYQVHAQVIANYYAGREKLGSENQTIEMELGLIPPRQGQRWFVQMNTLSWRGRDGKSAWK